MDPALTAANFRAKHRISKKPIAIYPLAPHLHGANVFLFRPTVSYSGAQSFDPDRPRQAAANPRAAIIIGDYGYG